jgi:uncharacterized RDD family membrane protein YckC
MTQIPRRAKRAKRTPPTSRGLSTCSSWESKDRARGWSLFAVLLLAVSVTLANAQAPGGAPPASQPATPAQPPAAPVPDVPPPAQQPDIFDVQGASREAFRLGQDFTLSAGDAVTDATVIFGDADVAGQVVGDLIVVFGTLRLAGTAAVAGDLVVVGGNATAEPGARVRRDLAIVGGNFSAAPDFMPGGEQIIIGSGMLGDWFEGFVPYIVRGLLWGRLIVPDLPWVWGALALFFLVYLAINLLFDGPVRACATTLVERPLTAFGVGLLVLLLVGPICLLLAVSVIGLAVVPFVFCALLAGWVVGKVAVARWIGLSIVAEESDNRAHAVRSFVIGFALISIAYMIPVVGIVTWAIVGVLGLGAASLAFLSAYRRENPKPIAPAPEVPPPPAPTPYSPGGGVTPEPSPPMAYESLTPPAAPAASAAAAAVPLAAPSPSVLLSMPHALFRDRLAAFVLDIVLVAIVVQPFDAEDVFLPFLLIYHIGFWAWKQTTVGGIICQLRVVRTDGAPFGLADALVRGLASIFSLALFFIGALWMLRDPDRQTWHDKIAGTFVVKVPRNWPL